MPIPYRVFEPTDRFYGKMRIFSTVNLPENITFTIRFYSSSRVETDYEIFDENDQSMGRQMFTCLFGPILVPLTLSLIENINVLLEEYGRKIMFEDFTEITKEAINFCEGKYGNNFRTDGDCVIYIS